MDSRLAFHWTQRVMENSVGLMVCSSRSIHSPLALGRGNMSTTSMDDCPKFVVSTFIYSENRYATTCQVARHSRHPNVSPQQLRHSSHPYLWPVGTEMGWPVDPLTPLCQNDFFNIFFYFNVFKCSSLFFKFSIKFIFN